MSRPNCFMRYREENAAQLGCKSCAYFVSCSARSRDADGDTSGCESKAARDPNGSPLSIQVGGGHYKDMKIQPVEYIHGNGIGFIEGSVIKYVSRWRSKGGLEDLRKARHFLDMLIELESGGPSRG